MTSLKEQLVAGFVESREKLVDLTHPAKPELVVRCATVVVGERVRQLAVQADKGKKPYGWAEAVLIGEQTREIRNLGPDSEPLRDDDGELATFGTRGVMEFFGATTLAECVLAAYDGSDIIVTALARSLLDQSGYGDDVEVEPVDPTRGA